MGVYSVISVDEFGVRKKNTIEASSVDKVRSILHSEGKLALDVKEAGALDKDISLGGKVKTKDIAVFCQQMESMLKAGVAVVDALGMVSATTSNSKLKKALIGSMEKIKAGESFAGSLARYPSEFPQILIQMVKAGEEAGALDRIFGRLALQMEKNTQVQSKVKKALSYPKMLIIVTVLAMTVVCAVVVPQFVSIFEDAGTELPFVTKMFVALSDLVTKKWYILLAIVVGAFSAWKIFLSTEFGARKMAFLKLKLPIFKDLECKTASANFARTLGTLLLSGMDYPKALVIAGDTMSNIFFKEAVEDIRKGVENGSSLALALKNTGLFPELLENLLQIGESTGNVESMLENAADYFEDEVETVTATLTSALQPAVVVFMGLVIGSLVYSIYSPMFSMYSSIG